MDEEMVQKIWSVWNSYSNLGLNKHRGTGGNKSVNQVQKENLKLPGLQKHKQSEYINETLLQQVQEGQAIDLMDRTSFPTYLLTSEIL